MTDSVWLRTLRQLEALPVEVAERAMRTFVERHGDGSKDERYLIGIARSENQRAQNGGGGGRANPTPVVRARRPELRELDV